MSERLLNMNIFYISPKTLIPPKQISGYAPGVHNVSYGRHVRPFVRHWGCRFSGNLVLRGNFRKFTLIVNITDNRETSVDVNETMHATPMSTINHENNVLVLILVHRVAIKADRM